MTSCSSYSSSSAQTHIRHDCFTYCVTYCFTTALLLLYLGRRIVPANDDVQQQLHLLLWADAQQARLLYCCFTTALLLLYLLLLCADAHQDPQTAVKTLRLLSGALRSLVLDARGHELVLTVLHLISLLVQKYKYWRFVCCVLCVVCWGGHELVLKGVANNKGALIHSGAQILSRLTHLQVVP